MMTNLCWILLTISISLSREASVEARAVNISNTWTLPQEGFSVFYRFFRDKISWFEADAVCQFHHANLVTVDNGIQFDAARAFLKELDVTEPVWIGLMRPQNSERFVWTNAKSLAPVAGYWAESLPVIDSPLCAVIDPLRDFRWHALRCGGPETAAFLCELSVPSWASDCAITALPSLTIQYMSDSGTVQLSRDCGDEGGRHMTCKGKQDRETMLKQLMCTDENAIEMSVNNLIMPEDNVSAAKSINHEVTLAKEMENTESDNTEDNNIDVSLNRADVAPGNDNSLVKITLEDLMVGDQPVDEPQTLLTDEVTKTPSQKKGLPIEKKPYSGKKMRGHNPLDDMMMGDQPVADSTTPEVLPHVKKMLQQDLKLKDLPPLLDDSSSSLPPEDQTKIVAPSTFIPSTETPSEPTTTIFLSTTVEVHKETTDAPTNDSSTDVSEPPETSIANEVIPILPGNPVIFTEEGTGKNIVHPMHISSDSSKQATSGFSKSHRKEEATPVSADDHFIPPMLLVKAKFTSAPSTRSHLEVITESPNSTINSADENHTKEETSERNSVTQTKENATETENQQEGSTSGDLPSSSPTVSPPVSHSVGITDKTELIQEVTPSSTQSPAPSAAASVNTESLPTTTKPESSTPAAEGADTTLSPSSSNYLLAQRRLDYENSFSNIENYQPYRPNRRRSLTKPDSVSYLKKILG